MLARARLALDLRRFVREQITDDGAIATVRERLARRPERFVAKIRRDVFEMPASPYRRMLAAAHIDRDRFAELVGKLGVEGTLAELVRRDVFVSYEEFKALSAGQSAGPRFDPGCSFDLPRRDSGVDARSSASRSAGTRLTIDLPSHRDLAVHRLLRMVEHGDADWPHALLMPGLPGFGGISMVLTSNLAGRPIARWFSPGDPNARAIASRLQEAVLRAGLRLAGGAVPAIEQVSLADPEPVARWVASEREKGRGCVLTGYAGSLVRVARAAQDRGLDISGSHFYMVGEASTPAKLAAVRAAGCTPIVSYSIAEVGHLANQCAHAVHPDELHLFTDAFAIVTRRRRLEAFNREVGAFLVTALAGGSPKALLNVEIDDYGVLEQRECACVWGRLGLTTMVRDIRSFVKMTAEGMTLVGTDLIDVIERELPERFGGGALDYQLVEDGRGAEVTLAVRVSPSVGEVDEAQIIDLLHRRLAAAGAVGRMMSGVWRDAGTLRVERRVPEATADGKVFPLHVLR